MNQDEMFRTFFNKTRNEIFELELRKTGFVVCLKNKTKWRNEILRNLSSHSVKLYFYFEKFINKFKARYYCFPSWKTIRTETNLSVCGISSALKELEINKLIKIYKCSNKTTRYSKSIYFLMEYIGEIQFSNYLNLLVHIFKVPLNLKQM